MIGHPWAVVLWPDAGGGSPRCALRFRVAKLGTARADLALGQWLVPHGSFERLFNQSCLDLPEMNLFLRGPQAPLVRFDASSYTAPRALIGTRYGVP